MCTTVLRDFFIDEISDIGLADGLSQMRFGADQTSVDSRVFEGLSTDFLVLPEHLIRLCDAVLMGRLLSSQLELISTYMMASDCFIWESGTSTGDRVARTLYEWSSPEVNYVLQPATIAKFRHRLLTGQEIFSKLDLGFQATTAGHVVGRTWKNYG